MEENLEHSEWLKGMKNTGFTTPSNYFEGLTEGIQARLAEEKLKSVVTEGGFVAPEGYFTQLQADIISKTSGSSKAKPEPKLIRLWHSKMLKYASAACFVIIAGIGTLYFNQQSDTGVSPMTEDMAMEQMLYDIDEEAIIEHIETNPELIQKATASELAMENYILSNYSQNDLETDF